MRAVPQSRRVFVDTSAYFALANPRDASYELAVGIHRRLIEERWRLFTTNLIIVETHALALRRLGRTVAATVIHDIDRSTTTVVRVSFADERTAREIIDR